MPTRFRLDVIQPSANNAVLEILRQPVDDRADPRFAPAVINGRSAFIDNLTAAIRRRRRGNADVALDAHRDTPVSTARSSVRPMPTSGRR